jgi:hypothetical protein
MKPNNLGGRTFQDAEVPVVISAASHQDEELAGQFAQTADRYEVVRSNILAGRELLGNRRRSYGAHPDLAQDVEDKSRLKLNQPDTNRALGYLMTSYQDGVLFPDDQPVARKMLLEMGLVKPTDKDRFAKFGRVLSGRK